MKFLVEFFYLLYMLFSVVIKDLIGLFRKKR